MSLEKPVPFEDASGFDRLFQRRIGHITSIQIRNLTPFPGRDTLTSALSKPTSILSSTHGHVADDLDATLTRKRTRRVSTNSISTLRSLRSDDGESAGTDEGLDRRKRASSRLSEKSATIGRTAPTLRPQRNRTTSLASVFPESIQSSQGSYSLDSNVDILRIPTSLQDHSQPGLEKIIGARLVETFLAITVISEPPTVDVELPTTTSLSFSSPSTPVSPRNGLTSPPRKGSPSSPGSSSNSEKPHRDSWASTSIASTPSTSSLGHYRSMSTAAVSRKETVKPAAGSPLASSSIFPPSPGVSPSLIAPPVPDYISSIHRPSTNPSFSLDPKSEFASWTDFSAVKLNVRLWAKIHGYSNRKGKEKDRSHDNQNLLLNWQVLEQWTVNLNELTALPNLNSEDPSHQSPSNTLLITLNPPGKTFYAYSLPQSSYRTTSPNPGYSSDPEFTVQKDDGYESSLDVAAFPSRRRRQRGRRGREIDEEEYVAKTAGWKDLFKLVTIWTTIKDNEKSLEDLVRGLDLLIADDQVLPLKREISERECRIAELRTDCANASSKSQELRDEILIRRDQLTERQNMIAYAEQQEDDDQQEREEIEEEVLDERARLVSLRSLSIPARTALISTLSYLFPIELRSSPDLLFTIIDIPLPIPSSPNDSAPPLILPMHADVNEETVATALGYVAIVVQILAAYLGHVLVYPVTYIGSRSLIRDGISAMVGPRMFPLFSKGVDTYRFEYGVFLLNKNIEMLMVEHDLRAIDIRHTLPNLKNLLLTLTDGEDIPFGPHSQLGRVTSSISSLSDLESPRPQSSASLQTTTNSNSTTPKARSVDLPSENTPPASGSSSPTALNAPTNVSMDTLKKTSRFLGGLTPLADFLRVRYPSSLLSRNVDDSAAPPDADKPLIPSSTSAIAKSNDALKVVTSESEEVGAPGRVSGNLKVADRTGEAMEVETSGDPQVILVKSRPTSVWKMQ
ncbi:UV radiation resistance protein and autophagy-related subunit 14-domain-containing protein [Lentinula aciculospora]|uniref:Autophagy-related protein 14 n=1 Tax=Lentinula aciculospora TaxID=153920 RepID=A0A9W9DUG7_9AGAR|nr:UV radiation resistance protein and autophagy-related subunit 14-domain-containing protein [Lentinula aciculospora]